MMSDLFVYQLLSLLCGIILIPWMFTGKLKMYEDATTLRTTLRFHLATYPVITSCMLLFHLLRTKKTVVKWYQFAVELLVAWIFGTFIYVFLVIVLGAPLFQLWLHTISFSSTLTCLTILPVCALTGGGSLFRKKNWDPLLRIFITDKPIDQMETQLFYQSYGVLIGSMIGSFPIPLDWDEPWQQYPTTLIYGAIVGYVFGSLAFFAMEGKNKQNMMKQF